MVAVAVAADNNRVAVATIATDAGTWGNDGGGGGVADEPDFVYQGTTAQSRKVSTSRIGRSYDDSAGAGSVDATATDRRHFLFKINITNYAALLTRTSPAAGIKIGSSGTAYDEFYVFGSDNYPIAGGWQIIPISVNVSGYRTGNAGATTGSPTRTAVDYYSLLADFSATSKGENVVIDAIDQGRGLKLTGGDGASTDGVFADFLSADEGTSNNRWGYVRSDATGLIYFVNGELSIGENTSETAVATVFQDTSGQVLVWENGYAETGYHRFRVNLGNATTDVDITGATFDSAGQLNNDADRGASTTEDTRLYVEATGTSGALNFIGCVFKNLSNFDCTSAVDVDTCDIQTADLTQSSADIFDSIIRTTSLANVATLDDPTFGTTTDLHDVEFVQEGTGHAIELTSTGTYDLQDITFTGYSGTPGTNLTPSSGSSAAAVYNSSGGAVTINVNGTGNQPSVRNAASSTTTVSQSVTVTVTCNDSNGDPIQGVNVRVEEDPGGTLIGNGTTNASGVYSFSYTGTTPQDAKIIARYKPYRPNQAFDSIVSGTGMSVSFTMIDNPIVNLP